MDILVLGDDALSEKYVLRSDVFGGSAQLTVHGVRNMFVMGRRNKAPEAFALRKSKLPTCTQICFLIHIISPHVSRPQYLLLRFQGALQSKSFYHHTGKHSRRQL